MGNHRKEELIRYLELLIGLRINGVNCTDKIEETLEELHGVMEIKSKPNFSLTVKAGVNAGKSQKITDGLNPFEACFE